VDADEIDLQSLLTTCSQMRVRVIEPRHYKPSAEIHDLCFWPLARKHVIPAKGGDLPTCDRDCGGTLAINSGDRITRYSKVSAAVHIRVNENDISGLGT
jgi:hypothetical protein